MPVFGTLDVRPRATDAPLMRGLDTEPWETAGAEILQVMFEIDDRDMAALLPRALHPTIPPVVIVTVAQYPESPAGSFALAQVRVGCRAGVRPRGFLLRAYSDSPRACQELGARWGYDCRPADVRLWRYHDRITGLVSLDGREVLRGSLVNPEPISGGDVQYVANMNLARVEEGGADRTLLVQVDPEYRFHRAERGRPLIEAFDRPAWSAEGVEPVYPVVASFTLCDTGFPRIRYVVEPDVPALQGTKEVG